MHTTKRISKDGCVDEVLFYHDSKKNLGIFHQLKTCKFHNRKRIHRNAPKQNLSFFYCGRLCYAATLKFAWLISVALQITAACTETLHRRGAKSNSVSRTHRALSKQTILKQNFIFLPIFAHLGICLFTDTGIHS